MNGRIQSGEWRVESGEWKVESGEWAKDGRWSFRVHRSPSYRAPSPLSARPDSIPPILCPLAPAHSPLSTLHSPLARRGFTLVELLVTVTIIGIIAAMSLGGFQMARRYAAEIKTKATIAKLDAIVNKRYESYFTRRLPIDTNAIYAIALNYYIANPPAPPTTPQQAAFRLTQWAKLDAMRDLMRMEMPDCAHDVITPPYQFFWEANQSQANKRDTSLRRFYLNNPPWDSVGAQDDYQNAQCLYLIVSSKTDELEQFSENEIGTITDPTTGRLHRVFVDGWGTPIMFLRWTPGFIPPLADTSLQTGNASNDHDPFDSRHIDNYAYKLYPLIYSAGPDKIVGLDIAHYFEPTEDPKNSRIKHLYTCYGQASEVGKPVDPSVNAQKAAGINDNITNHQIETK